MMDIGSTELLMIIIVAIVVIGPKDLPRALYKVGQVMGKAKGIVRHFRTGIDAMVREVELEEMEKQWKADNERILREHAATQPPPVPPAPPMEPFATPADDPALAYDAPGPATAPIAATNPVIEGER